MTIHVLSAGRPLCGFSDLNPGRWPEGNTWVRGSDVDETIKACADPTHEMHSLIPHKMCPGYMEVYRNG